MKTSYSILKQYYSANDLFADYANLRDGEVSASPIVDSLVGSVRGLKPSSIVIQLKPLSSSLHGGDSIDIKCGRLDGPLSAEGMHVSSGRKISQDMMNRGFGAHNSSDTSFIHSSITGQDVFSSAELSFIPERMYKRTAKSKSQKVATIRLYIGAGNQASIGDLDNGIALHIDALVHRHHFRHGTGLVDKAAGLHSQYNSRLNGMLQSLKKSLDVVKGDNQSISIVKQEISSSIPGLTLGWIIDFNIEREALSSSEMLKMVLTSAAVTMASSLSASDASQLVGSLQATNFTLLSMQSW